MHQDTATDPIRAFIGPLDKDTARVLAVVACLRHGVAYHESYDRAHMCSLKLNEYCVAAIHDRTRLVERVRRLRYPMGVRLPACSWVEAVTAVVIDDLTQWSKSGCDRELAAVIRRAATDSPASCARDPLVGYFLRVAGKVSTRPVFNVTERSIDRAIVTGLAPAVRFDDLASSMRIAAAEYIAREHPEVVVLGSDMHFDMAYTAYVGGGGRFEMNPRDMYTWATSVDAALRMVIDTALGFHLPARLLAPLYTTTAVTDHLATRPWPAETYIRYDAVLGDVGANVLLHRTAALAAPWL